MRALVLSGTVALTACDDSSTDPGGIPLDDLLGSYEAVVFESTSDGETVDWLEQGASILLTLQGDGSTAGNLFVPGGGEGGGDLDADLSGTFTYDPGTAQLALVHEADTFLRDLTFGVSRVPGSDSAVELAASGSFGGTLIEVVFR